MFTPRPAPYFQAQCSPFGFCSPASQPTYHCRASLPQPQPRRPQYSSFNNLFLEVDELLSEIDHEAKRQAQLQAHLEAHREAHRQRQQQKQQALRARFSANQTGQGWQVDGDIEGFTQDNINIEITDEHTLKITGNTKWQSEKPQSEVQDSAVENASEEPQKKIEAGNAIDTVTSNIEASATDSDTESHKSYQPTVEDDYEDLGAETSSLISASSGTNSQAEAKGKEKAVEEPTATTAAVVQHPAPEALAQQKSQSQERVHGTFQRTFRFPERIDIDKVGASFKEGALKVVVPRAHVPQVRRIAIL